VFTKRRFVNTDANTVAAAFVVDKTSFGGSREASDRDGSGDWHHCDGDHR
jgi:hypothetical protein